MVLSSGYILVRYVILDRSVWNYLQDNTFLASRLNTRQRETLNRGNDYYRKLLPRHKRKFESRLLSFLKSKHFIPRQMPEVTEEMQLLISACAVQITFGLSRIYLSHFNKILVYPDQYYSNISKKYHKGEVNPRYGIIVISWSVFKEGAQSNMDGIHLGIHEMAHAVHLENRIKNEEYDFIPRMAWNKYLELMDEEIHKIRRGGGSIFRAYAGKNEYEFFAVALEVFFEQYNTLRRYNESLYQVLTELLGQDPARILIANSHADK